MKRWSCRAVNEPYNRIVQGLALSIGSLNSEESRSSRGKCINSSFAVGFRYPLVVDRALVGHSKKPNFNSSRLVTGYSETGLVTKPKLIAPLPECSHKVGNIARGKDFLRFEIILAA
jgi:hypothetical protein